MAKDEELQKQKNSNDDSSDDENDEVKNDTIH
jgi:hypothetical protein